MNTGMTLQEIFDKAARHLLTQNARSVGAFGVGAGACAYRGKGGRKCAVGIFIDDDYYQESMEGESALTLVRGYPRALKSVFGEPSDDEVFTETEQAHLLGELQRVHDGCEPSEWPQRLAFLASGFNLNTDVLKEAQ